MRKVMMGIILSVIILNAQQLKNDLSQCISFLNEGDSQSCIECVDRLLPQLPPNSKGLALFFLGESYYSIAIRSAEKNEAVRLFQSSLTALDQALNEADLRESDFYYTALYKKAWCHYRLGELQHNSSEEFEKAYSTFRRISNSIEELYPFSLFLAGEAKLNLVTLQITNIDVGDENAVAQVLNSSIAQLNEAAMLFKSSVNAATSEQSLKNSAQLRIKDISLLKGLLYGLAGNISDAVKLLEEADYSTINLSPDKSAALAEAAAYSEVMRKLYLFLLTQSNSALLDFSNRCMQLGASFAAEKEFRLANADQAKLINDPAFVQLASPRGYYDVASQSISEAYFWKGMVQSVLNLDDDAVRSFTTFKDKVKGNPSPRQRRLLEEAELNIFQIDFRQAMASPTNAARLGRLRRLTSQIKEVNFSNPAQQLKLKRLSILAEAAQTVAQGSGQINMLTGINNLLRSTNSTPYQFINQLLPVAAQVVGQQRLFYLDVIDVLFQFAENAPSEELDFLKGISLMLRAEVQANPSASAQFYAQAIQKLTTVQKAGDAQSLQSYYGEAKYAQCRAKFFAKTWDPLRPQSIDLNEIKYLINQRRSLRTLYLLAEYCRDTGRYPEAVACYNIIKKKAYNDPDGRFWLVNAEAGIARCGSQDENVKLFQELGIQIEDVVFPDILTQVGNRPVMYEFLADTKFLQMQKAEEARKFLIAFGLPKKSLYPSKNILRYSWRVNDNIFETVTSPIDEKLTKIAAGLNVVVIDDSGKPPALISAFVDGIETSIQDGRFEVKDRALNTKANILIRANGYYPRYIEHFFSKPQTDTLIVPLIKEHWFEKNDFITDRKLLQVGDRFAENFIIVQDNKLLSTDSPLYKCIAESLYIRDFVFHRQGFYLFVDAQENRIVRIDNEQQSWENGTTFSLQFPSTIHPDFLKSPEGIAVDRKGNIYIADWGNHRVLMAQPNGIVTRQLGSFGKNVKGVMGEEIKFAYPTRIAVAEDTVGIAYNGKRIYQNALIFVADANGVHMVDETGRYLMTAVSPSRELPFGEFYSIAVEGFGKQAALFLANRKNGKILNFKAQ